MDKESLKILDEYLKKLNLDEKLKELDDRVKELEGWRQVLYDQDNY